MLPFIVFASCFAQFAMASTATVTSQVAAATTALAAAVGDAADAASEVPAVRYYDGPTYKVGPFFLRPALYRTELLLLAAAGVYVALHILGKYINRRRAGAWFEANIPTLKEEFALVGLDENTPWAEDRGDEYISYLSGRRGVRTGRISVVTAPLHDLAKLLYYRLRSYVDFGFVSGENRISIVVNLASPQGTPGAKFCFGVLRRDRIQSVREDNWDLRTFTAVSELKDLPDSFIVMTESGDVTNAVLRSADTGLLDFLRSDDPALEYFESLVISDMPATGPDEDHPELPKDLYSLILTLKVPPQAHAAATVPLISITMNLVDVLVRKTQLLPAAALTRIKRNRDNVQHELERPQRIEQLEKEREEQEKVLVEKRKLEREREERKIKNMTPEQRVKYLEKEQQKNRKKTLLKATKKMK